MDQRPRNVLYVGPMHGGDPLGIERFAAPRPRPDGSMQYVLSGRTRNVFSSSEVGSALAILRDHPIDLLVLEFRETAPAAGGGATRSARAVKQVAQPILEALYPDEGVHAGLARGRVLGLVGPDAAGAQRAFELGQLGIGSVLSAPSLEALHAHLDAVLRERSGGKVAVCLAGGGIEGLLYEVGVLRALDTFLVNRRVEDLDLFCGISAGAVIGAFLANGLGPEEIAQAFGDGTPRVDPIRKSDLFDLNVHGLGRSARALFAQTLGGTLRGEGGTRGPLSALARSVPVGAFRGKALGEYLRRHLEKPGMSNRFSELRRPLLIGATDMDTSEAVVFGRAPHGDVPVHQAVRASAALVPFYAPERIAGRYYIDGAFTRTTNMRVAVEEGATMVILVDPLVPVRSTQPGYVIERGGIFAGMQGLKALVNGRFDKAVRAIREMYPDVSFYLFRPDAEEMRILGGSPMKYFYRREVDGLAYRSTQAKIRGSYEQLRLDFARHGIEFRDPGGRPRGVDVDTSSALRPGIGL